MLLGEFERFPLLFGPSPVHRLERLSAHLQLVLLIHRLNEFFF